jgi:hypothetical protein
MAAQRATDERRHSSEVKADQEVLRRGQAELEKVLFAEPAADWAAAINRAIYLLRRFAATPEAQDPRYKKMIADVLDDFRRLADGPPESGPAT